MEEIATTCGICRSTGCGVLAYKDETGRVVKIRGNPKHPMSRGALCVKALAATEALYSPNRILSPLLRVGKRGEGKWKEIGWDEAIDRVADGMMEITKKYGKTAMCGVVGSPFRTHAAFVNLLMHAIGSPNMMTDVELCQAGEWLASVITTGHRILRQMYNPDIKNTDCLLIFGINPAYTKTPLWVKDWADRKKKGAKLIVVDPRRTSTAKNADIYLQITPGTDVALVLAMISTLIEEQLYDEEFVNKHCYGFEELKKHVEKYTPEKVEAIVGVPAADIRKAARMYAEAPTAGTWTGLGLVQNANSVQTHRAVAILVALAGNINKPGGNLLPTKYPGFKGNAVFWQNKEWRLPPEDEAKLISAKEYPLWAKYIKSCVNPMVIDAIRTGNPYPVRGLYVSGSNMASTFPNAKNVLRALESLDFLCVSEYEMTPVAMLADIILPKAHWLENGPDVTVNPYAKCLAAHQRVIEPQGLSKDENWICMEIMKNLEKKGADIDRKYIPWNSQEEYFEWTIEDIDIDLEELFAAGVVEYTEGTTQDSSEGDSPYKTTTGKVELWSVELEKLGYDPLPNYVPIEESRLTEEYPLYLLGGPRTLGYQHTRFRDCPTLRKREPDPYVAMHPETAEQLGLQDGDWASIETSMAKGEEAFFKVKITDDMRKDTVSVPIGWWDRGEPGPDYGCLESNPNVLIKYDDEEACDPVTGAALSRGLRCRVRKTSKKSNND